MGRNLLLLLGATVVALLLGEGLLRLVYRDLPTESWARAGFRDAPWSEKRAAIDAIDGVDAYNLSIPGDGPVRMYHRYLRHREAVDPDLVVVLAYVNDFHGPAAQAEGLAELRRSRPTPATGPETCRRMYDRSARDQLDRWTTDI